MDGFDFTRYKNLSWVSATEAAYINGTSVGLFDVVGEDQRVLYGKESGGVGAVEVSPCGNYLALAETSTYLCPL